MENRKVLVVATSRKTRGGITSVIKAHETGEQWRKYHCKWIETHRDGNSIRKLWHFIKSFFKYLYFLPFYDLVHIHTSEPPSALRKCLFVWLAKVWKKKVIVHFHAFSPETTVHGKYKWVYRYLFNKADAIIVLSEMWKGYVYQAFQLGNKIQVIYNPCTTEISNIKYKKKKYILYAGTINARKGYADMIKAFAQIFSHHPDWQLVFAGNGEIEKGLSLAKELGIEKQTIFLDWVNGKAKDKIFKEATIFCLPSYAEGFPMAILDAWAYGLPVITTPVGGIPDIAIDGINLLMFTPGDINKLAKQMEKLIYDKELRDKISQESTQLANTVFNIKNINKEIENLYNSFIK